MPNANIILILLAVAIVLCIGGLSTAHFAAAKRRKELPGRSG